MEPAAPPGVAADQAILGDLELRAASVVGAHHRCDQPALPRQDAYRVARDGKGRHLIVAVADGMSDSARSELGAQVAVSQAVALVRRHLDAGEPAEELSAPEIFGAVSAGMVQAATDRGLTPADVRATLAVAVVPAQPEADGTRTVWTGRLGDSVVWSHAGRGWRPTAEAKPSFDGSALGEFLPYHPGMARHHLLRLPGRAAVGVFTDGVADALTGIGGAARWFGERWRVPPPLASFVLDVDFDARTQTDDRTAVVVWCRPDWGSEP